MVPLKNLFVRKHSGIYSLILTEESMINIMEEEYDGDSVFLSFAKA